MIAMFKTAVIIIQTQIKEVGDFRYTVIYCYSLLLLFTVIANELARLVTNTKIKFLGMLGISGI